MTEPGIGEETRTAGTGSPVWHTWTAWLERTACAEGETRETRYPKMLFTASVIAVVPAGLVWAAIYFAYDERAAAALPFAYVVLTLVDLLIFLRLRRFELFRNAQQVMILALPFGLQLALGGFVGSSVAILWSFIAVLMALLFGSPRGAIWWFVAYVIAIAAAAAIQPSLAVDNNLPHWLVTTLFVLNVATVSLVSFAVLLSFVTDRRKLRALEVAFLNQEMALRQSEKMATLGTLAAGVAHELNNPAAAARRASDHLRDAIGRFELAHAGADVAALTPEGRELLLSLQRTARELAASPSDLDALERSDREQALEEWLEEHGVADGRELAPSLVDQGLDVHGLSRLAGQLDREALPVILRRTTSGFAVHRLLHEIGECSRRVSEIVAVLKSYSFLGQAPVQPIDLHEGLDNTLVILRPRLQEGVDIRRDYCADLPLVPAYGAELNEVWTNLLGNAVDAVDGKGTITIRTRRDGEWVVVEIDDDGPGIPDEAKTRIFDPFFTTKEPGKGTGLGLATSYSIVTDKHHGRISVESRPGLTRFIVRLPLEAPFADDGSPARE